jgi:hypothetical protein
MGKDRTRSAVIAVALALMTVAPAAQQPAVDLLIVNGRVLDGTGNP